ncbi:MAG: class I SAM-dependent methyltransferase [Gammaproteobacteria bacterium]
MLTDPNFQSHLERYLEAHTTPVSPLLLELIEETKRATALPNMLSGPVEGRFLSFLIKLIEAKRVLEIGTFTGFSALIMAEALSDNGRLVTHEIRKEHADIAQKYFNQSPYGHKIRIKLGSALALLPEDNDIYDFAFIDADKQNYPNYYDIVIPKLRSGGLLAIDNALWKGQVLDPQDASSKAIADTNRKASLDHRVETVLLPIRDGILLVRKH